MPDFLNIQLASNIQILCMALLDGGLLIMGITCISLLNRRARKITAHRKFWQAYIAVLMFLNISCLIQSFLIAFYQLNFKKYQEAYVITSCVNNITIVTMLVFTDGVLVSYEIPCL